MELSAKHLWEQCATIVKDNVTDEAYSKWIAPIMAVKYDRHCLVIRVPSHFFVETIEANYSDLIGKALNRITGKPTRLMYQVCISETPVNVPSEPPVPTRKPVSHFEQEVLQRLDPQLNTSFHFGNLIEGQSNKLAYTAGKSIAKEPGKTIFNPLFVFGKSGVGKTHLLHAIGNEALDKHPQLRVLYVPAHIFQVQYSQAYLQNKINDFIHFYQSIDLLLVDDIHELAGRTGTQNVFFHVFNHLHQMGKQIVFTCDRAPKDLAGVEERLLTRFKWGLTAEIKQPDFQLRLNILHSKIRRDGLDFPEEVVHYIARHAKDNVRDLEGIVTSLIAHAIIEGSNIDLALCRQVVESSVNLPDEAGISMDSIEDIVSQFYHIDKDLLRSRSRKQEVAQARQVAMYLAKKHTDCSYSLIGELLGKRNHATVIHACKTVEAWIETDQTIRSDIKKIEDALASL